MKHSILIISYHFPPHDTISSRRWAKFAKYLLRQGHEVTVLAAKPSASEKSPWDEDIQGIKVFYVPCFYPRVLNRHQLGFFSRLKYKAWIVLLKLVVKGTIYDRAIFWKSRMLNAASRIIEDNKVEFVITNGPPHRVMYYSVLLTKKHKHVRVVSDFRDPWTWWYNLGYPYLNQGASMAEKGMQDHVINHSSLITVPITEMKEKLEALYPKAGEKIKVLPHAFDGDHIVPKKEHSGQYRKLVYFGNIYAGQDKRFKQVAQALGKGGKETGSLDFYSDTRSYERIFEGMSNVRYHNPLKEKELFKKLVEFDAVLIVFPDIFSHYFSTKIMEIVALRLPILLVCKEGELSRFIKKGNLGIHILDHELEPLLSEILSGPQPLHYDKSYDINAFSFEAQTKNLVQWLNEISPGSDHQSNR